MHAHTILSKRNTHLLLVERQRLQRARLFTQGALSRRFGIPQSCASFAAAATLSACTYTSELI